MPKSHASVETVQLTFRVPVDVESWLKKQAEQNQESLTDVMRRFIDDFRTLYGLPEIIVEKLEADAKALGRNRRQYLMQLLALRYEQVLAKGPGFDKQESGKGRRT